MRAPEWRRVLGELGMPVVIHPMLADDPGVYYVLEGRAYGCRRAVLWLMLFSMAQGWPVTDCAAAEEDG